MSTKTKTLPTAPKPGTVKAAHARIDELEELLKNVEVREEEVIPSTLQAVPKKYMATGRVNFPSIGGLALPKGLGLNAFVDIEFEDIADAKGVLHPPSREDVTERLKVLANKQYPLNTGVVLCDISVLPTGW